MQIRRPNGVLDPELQSLSPFGSVFFVSLYLKYLGEARAPKNRGLALPSMISEPPWPPIGLPLAALSVPSELFLAAL